VDCPEPDRPSLAFAPLPGEAVETFSIQQLQNISPERFEQLIADRRDRVEGRHRVLEH